MDNTAELFYKYGIKKTRQRVLIISELINSPLPLTAVDLHSKLNDLSLSTIYRALELFCEKGIVQKSLIHDSDSYYYEFVNPVHKHHAVCLGCNKITYVDICPLHDINVDMNSFTVTSHKLELYGYCESCRKKSNKK